MSGDPHRSGRPTFALSVRRRIARRSGGRAARRGHGALGRALSLISLIAGGAGLGCRPSEEAARPPNVVIVLVDALRADHLSLYGYSRPTSPHLDRLAGESVVFEQARAQASCTVPSANSILTGRAPARFLGQGGGAMGIPPAVTSLAERFDRAGWATVAVSASPIVRASPTRFNPGGGFQAGFDVFDEACLWSSAACVNRQALTHLAAAEEPFFLYLHYMEPHGPYSPPDGWERRFAAAGDTLPEWVLRGDPNPLAAIARGGGGVSALPAGALEHLVALYDDEIAYFDESFRQLMATWERSGLADRTLIVLLADHGEAFLEKGYAKHCNSVYDSEIRTPLLIRPPGGTAGRRIGSAVANLDVAPTVLAAAGLPIPEELEGTSLWPAVTSPAGEARLPGRAFAAWAAQRALVAEGRKVIYHLEGERWEAFDLAADPGETQDLLATRPEAVRRLQSRLARWIREAEGRHDDAARRDREATEQLRALGYLN